MKANVKEFMTGSPISIEPEMSALAALDLMIDHAIQHLPVVDSERRVSGIVSFHDLRAALPTPISLVSPPSAEARQQALDVTVSEAMTPAPATIRADASLDQAVARMIEGRFGCLPIVDDDGRLDGILTQTDLLQALATVLWSTQKA